MKENMNKVPPHCYSQRMLNPFRGVMNVLDTGDAYSFAYLHGAQNIILDLLT